MTAYEFDRFKFRDVYIYKHSVLVACFEWLLCILRKSQQLESGLITPS